MGAPGIGQARFLPSVPASCCRPPKARPRTGACTAAASSTRCASAPACAFGRNNREALARAEQEFGVPAEIIVGIIGVETIYGQQMGNFRVMDALATLAFDFPAASTRAPKSAPNSSAASWSSS
jgi:membrane-bound lytic murein transglycosylase B